jgi:hypothetical protein
MTANAKIIEAAPLWIKRRHIESEGEELDSVNRECEAVMVGFDAADIAMVAMVAGLMEGKPYDITSDNQDAIGRCISIATDIGATAKDSKGHPLLATVLPDLDPSMKSVTIYPPSRH